MLISLLALAAVATAPDPDGVVTTAPAGHQAVATDAVAPVAEGTPTAATAEQITPHGLTTEQQIDRWVGQRANADRPFSQGGNRWVEPVDDRKMHGEVSAGIGTGDYSSYSASVSIPVGETARIGLSYRETKNGYGFYGDPYGYGYSGRAQGYRSRGYGYGYGGYGYDEPRSSRSLGFSFRSDSSD